MKAFEQDAKTSTTLNKKWREYKTLNASCRLHACKPYGPIQSASTWSIEGRGPRESALCGLRHAPNNFCKKRTKSYAF